MDCLVNGRRVRESGSSTISDVTRVTEYHH